MIDKLREPRERHDCPAAIKAECDRQLALKAACAAIARGAAALREVGRTEHAQAIMGVLDQIREIEIPKLTALRAACPEMKRRKAKEEATG